MPRDSERIRHELEVLTRLSRTLASTAKLDDLLYEIVRSIGEALDFEDCVLFLYDEDTRQLVQRAAWGAKLDSENRKVRNPMRVALGQGIVGSVAVSRLVEIVDDVTIDRRYIPDGTTAGSELAVPILHQDRLVGVIDSERPGQRSFGAGDAVAATRFADLCSPAIVLLRRRELESRAVEEALREAEYRLRHFSTHDALTGLMHRGPFEEELATALAARAAGGPEFVVLALSVDRFHDVNQALGPAGADDVLKRVAAILRERTGRGDVAARAAGVEFALLLRNVTLEQAVERAQALRTEIGSLAIPSELGSLATSFGVVAPGSAPETADALLARAHRARQAAKAEGGGVASA
jgi:diguanylate cyclase (GGDEF)-like protein